MVRMSDILKMIKERKAKQQAGEVTAESSKEQLQAQPIKSGPPQEQELKPSIIQREKPKTKKKRGRQPRPEIKISQSIMEWSKLYNKEESITLYKETIGLVKAIYDKVRADKENVTEVKDINIIIEKFVNQQSLGNDNILDLINSALEDNHIYNHVVNVCIISIELGIGLGYDRTKLIELGTAAILHDIGMMRVYDIYTQPRQLSTAEYNEIKKHTTYSAEILKKFRNIYKKCITVALQEHERIDGSGYPHGLKDESIDIYARIIGLADVYEAMTHPRPCRSKIHLWKALKELIGAKDSFGGKLVKVLIERNACPYTLGSYVKLSSGEKGRVIKRNLGSPLRPVIEIIYDADGQKLEETKTIDLTKYPTVSIKGHLEREEMNV